MKKSIVRGSILAAAVVLVLGVLIFYYSFVRVANNVSWKLPNKDRLTYLIYNDDPGPFVADVKKILLWRKSDGSVRAFSISNIGGVPHEVQLKINEKKSVIWLIGISRTIHEETQECLCALDIETGDFVPMWAIEWDEKASGNLAELSKNANMRVIKEIALSDEGHIIKPN